MNKILVIYERNGRFQMVSFAYYQGWENSKANGRKG